MLISHVSGEHVPSTELQSVNFASLARRERRRTPAWVRWSSLACVLILLLSAVSGAALAGNSPPANASDNELHLLSVKPSTLGGTSLC